VSRAPKKPRARKAKKQTPKRERHLMGRPVLTLWGIPVIANPHIAPGVVLVHTTTHDVLLRNAQ
jgi:hypothetical protein